MRTFGPRGIAATTLALLLGAGAFAACDTGHESASSTSTGKEASTVLSSTGGPTTTTVEAEPTDLMDAGAVALEITGDWLAAGAGSVWLSNPPTNEVYRLDPRSGKTMRTIRIPQTPCAAGDVGFRAFWTATCEDPGLARIDAETNRVGHVRLPVTTIHGGEGSIGAGAGAVWLVIDGSQCQACLVARIDPQTLRVVARVRVQPGASSVRVGQGAVWVTNPARNLVQRIDVERNRVDKTTPVGPTPRFFAVDDTAVWTLNQIDGSVTRLDPETAAVEETIRANVFGEGGDMTAGGGWVWARGQGVLLTRIDPQTNAIVERYGPSSGSGGVIVGYGAVWISAHDVATVWRLPLSNL